jgi:tRNA G10  N-methylase Trm11
MDSRAQYRKATVRLARLIAAETGWSNNPSNYSLDIRVARINSSEYVLWRDVRWIEPRRSEPRAVLPASIHPTVAAALCMAGGIVSADVFCDPCCGAGTIIAERLGYGPAKEVFGFDISKEAVRLSQQNLSRFSSAVKIRMADMRSLPLENNSVTIIVANLPFGIRVGDRGQNRNLYRDFLKEAYRVLTPKGRLIAYTHDASAFESGCRDAGWQGVQRVASVHAGGLTVLVYRAVRS